MATPTIEERIARLEKQVAQLLARKAATPEVPWWERNVGAFKDDPIYDEAMRLGAEYRRSQPTAAEEIEAIERAGGFVPQPDEPETQG